jgi:hypothetical protein
MVHLFPRHSRIVWYHVPRSMRCRLGNRRISHWCQTLALSNSPLQQAVRSVAISCTISGEGVEQTSRWLAERDLLRGGARRAIEIEWEVCGEQEKSKYPEIRIGRLDDSA